MLIEITGCTGAGKTTIVHEILQSLRQKNIKTLAIIDSTNVEPFDRANEKLIDITTFNYIYDIIISPFILLSIFLNIFFFTKSLYYICVNFKGMRQKFNITRLLLRRLGINTFAHFYSILGYTVLTDEGIFHLVHNIFVHTNKNKITDLTKYIQLIPIKGHLIIVKSSSKKIIYRLKLRGDWSPRVANITDLKVFVKNAIYIYEKFNNVYNKNTTKHVIFNDNQAETKINVKKIIDTLLRENND